MSGWPSLFGIALASAVLIGSRVLDSNNFRFPWLVNLTESLPKGLYEDVECDFDDPSTLIQFFPPEASRRLYVDRGYLKEGMSLVKPIGARGGDRVCWEEDSVSVNGRRVVGIPAADAMGRPLPRPTGCEWLDDSSILPLQVDHPRSLDGRFFGTIPRASIQACVRPRWVAKP